MLLSAIVPVTGPHEGLAQTTPQPDLSQRIQQLTDAMARAQQQIEDSQRQLQQMREQLRLLQDQMQQSRSATSHPEPSSSSTSADLQDLREQQAIQASQIATQAQTKVESESKYPVRITGLLLLNGFVNTNAVDMPSTPTVAVPGPGTSGATLRQTILGFDAFGPHLFGASSHADLRVDFAGSSSSGVAPYSGYYNGTANLLRLRTAHASLQWPHTEAFFSLDRPIFSPDSPSSLVAVAEPALAWSGNLWTWNPQIGLTHDLPLYASTSLHLQAALIDVGDAPSTPLPSSTDPAVTSPSTAEQSRWPGVEARIALAGPHTYKGGNHLGIGGYFAPHHTWLGKNFDSWAASADTHLLLPARLSLTASLYRGLGLGGLGAGAYKDFVYRMDSDSSHYYLRPLDDIGGWAQLQERFSERLQLNAAFGIDNAFAGQFRRYAVPGGTLYQNLARNRTFTGNVIYSPSSYLLFSVEFRHIDSSSVLGTSTGANVLGLAAGYKF